jgi:hypothetical protein
VDQQTLVRKIETLASKETLSREEYKELLDLSNRMEKLVDAEWEELESDTLTLSHFAE